MDPNEMVMGVPALATYMLNKDKYAYLEALTNSIEYRRRGDVEGDHSFKQIIPYVVLWNTRGNAKKLYVTKRVKAGDPRLLGGYSIGVGGHIRLPEKIQEGLKRELMEEVGLNLSLLPSVFHGVLSSDATEVDRDHIGLVYFVNGVGLPEDLKCLEEELEGQWMTQEEIRYSPVYNKLESWSRIIFDAIYSPTVHNKQ